MNRVFQFILLAVLMGCSRTSPPSGVIDRFGTYISPDKRLSVAISREGRSIVAFTVSSASDGRSLHTERIGSDAQRWCFYWDEKGRLWAYSSDTGYFAVITIQPDGSISKSEVDKNTPMPKPIYEFLPVSLKRHWGI